MSSSSTQTVLHFLRSQIEAQRHVARLERGAVQFAITRESDGRTEYWSMLIGASEVNLEPHVLPLEHPEPIVTFSCTDLELVRVSRGESTGGLSAEGDAQLLAKLTLCFRPASNLIGVRQT